MKPELQIGKTLKPRGLAGEIKIQFYSSLSSRYKNIKSIKLDGIPYTVKNISLSGEFGFIKLDGIDSIEKAETLRNKVISVNRNDLPSLDDGNYYIVDLIGINVYLEEEFLGNIFDVLQYGAADVYCVKTKDSTLSFPAIKQLFKEVNIDENKMVLNGEIFKNVVVYDD